MTGYCGIRRRNTGSNCLDQKERIRLKAELNLESGYDAEPLKI
jgi:hypothetical protein